MPAYTTIIEILKEDILTVEIKAMPNLNNTGPDGEGTKTGRKLGKCAKTEIEKTQTGELGKGLGKRRHSGGGMGEGKRFKYNQPLNSEKEK